VQVASHHTPDDQLLAIPFHDEWVHRVFYDHLDHATSAVQAFDDVAVLNLVRSLYQEFIAFINTGAARRVALDPQNEDDLLVANQVLAHVNALASVFCSRRWKTSFYFPGTNMQPDFGFWHEHARKQRFNERGHSLNKLCEYPALQVPLSTSARQFFD
jgi:hypothetical protein